MHFLKHLLVVSGACQGRIVLYLEKLTKLARYRGGVSETWGVSSALKMFIVHLLRIRTLETGSIGQGTCLIICTLGYFCLSQCTLSGKSYIKEQWFPGLLGVATTLNSGWYMAYTKYFLSK